MHTSITRALTAWKTADLAASDAEGLLRVQLLKYVEGIAGPPALSLVHRTGELRRASHTALIAALDLLRTVDGLRQTPEPHVLAD